MFSKKNHRGRGQTLEAHSDRKKNSFIIKSVKLVSCDSDKTENEQDGDSSHIPTQSSLAKSQRPPVASGAHLTSGNSEDDIDKNDVEGYEASQSSGAASAFCRPILLVLLLMQTYVSA